LKRLFGADTAMVIVLLLPGAASLTLDAAGFEVCKLNRRRRVAWAAQASGFAVGDVGVHGRRRVVIYDEAGTADLIPLNRGLIGRNAGLPDTYGLSAEELAQPMTQWRELALVRRS
jgi:hypothetical protein